MGEHVDHQARNHGWARCLGEGCPLCAVGVPPRGAPELECREVELPSYPWPDGSPPNTAISHAFASGAPGTRCQCGAAEVGPGFTTVPASTLAPEPQLSPGQIRAFERAAELVRRWETRGDESDTTHG